MLTHLPVQIQIGSPQHRCTYIYDTPICIRTQIDILTPTYIYAMSIHIHTPIGLVWFLCFNGISTLMGYLMPNLFLLKNSNSIIQLITGRGEITGFIPPPRVIVRLVFGLAYCNTTVQHFSHYTTGTAPYLYGHAHTHIHMHNCTYMHPGVEVLICQSFSTSCRNDNKPVLYCHSYFGFLIWFLCSLFIQLPKSFKSFYQCWGLIFSQMSSSQ